jgi:O-glycosyl hydrolase
LQAGQFLRYTSTKDGQRLQLTVDSFSSNNDENESVLLVDRDKKYQMINGFGGAITDAVALNLRTLSNKTQQQLLKYVIDIHQLATQRDIMPVQE